MDQIFIVPNLPFIKVHFCFEILDIQWVYTEIHAILHVYFSSQFYVWTQWTTIDVDARLSHGQWLLKRNATDLHRSIQLYSRTDIPTRDQLMCEFFVGSITSGIRFFYQAWYSLKRSLPCADKLGKTSGISRKCDARCGTFSTKPILGCRTLLVLNYSAIPSQNSARAQTTIVLNGL